MTLEPLTKTQQRYYDAICQYEDDKKLFPTITELQRMLNCGRGSVQEGIYRLREKGYLVRVGQYGEPRAYRTRRRHVDPVCPKGSPVRPGSIGCYNGANLAGIWTPAHLLEKP
jgi:DNA-binding Lrp family transcriptional regulator